MRTARPFSARDLPAFPTRFAGFVTARNTHFFEREITQRRIKYELPVHASNRTLQMSQYYYYEHRLSPASNKSEFNFIMKTNLLQSR